MIGLETKCTQLKVMKDQEGGKSVMASALQSGLSRCTTATILNKNKAMEVVKGTASLKARRLINIREGPDRYMEKLLVTWIEEWTQSISHSAL